jgi:hypothetical protein
MFDSKQGQDLFSVLSPGRERVGPTQFHFAMETFLLSLSYRGVKVATNFHAVSRLIVIFPLIRTSCWCCA